MLHLEAEASIPRCKAGVLRLVRRDALQNFSSVVGPNGSGKSNVIDAMLFVFGFKAKKVRLSGSLWAALKLLWWPKFLTRILLPAACLRDACAMAHSGFR